MDSRKGYQFYGSPNLRRAASLSLINMASLIKDHKNELFPKK